MYPAAVSAAFKALQGFFPPNPQNYSQKYLKMVFRGLIILQEGMLWGYTFVCGLFPENDNFICKTNFYKCVAAYLGAPSSGVQPHEQNLFMEPPHEQILFVELPHEQILFMELPHEQIMFVEPENQKNL